MRAIRSPSWPPIRGDQVRGQARRQGVDSDRVGRVVLPRGMPWERSQRRAGNEKGGPLRGHTSTRARGCRTSCILARCYRAAFTKHHRPPSLTTTKSALWRLTAKARGAGEYRSECRHSMVARSPTPAAPSEAPPARWAAGCRVPKHTRHTKHTTARVPLKSLRP